MRRASLLAALFALPLPALATEALSTLSLAHAEILAVQLPQAGNDAVKGDPTAYRTLAQLHAKVAAVRPDQWDDAALALSWKRLDRDLDGLLASADGATADALSADALAFMQRAEALLHAGDER